WHWRRRVVLSDQSAYRDAGEIVEQRPHRLLDRTAYILEINVDASRTHGLELAREVCGAMVDAGVEAEVLDHVAALVRPPSDADCTTSLDLGDLPDHRAAGAPSPPNRHAFTSLVPAHL